MISVKDSKSCRDTSLFCAIVAADPATLSKTRYVWKLVYMFMLGYEIDFGHMEMICLIGSTK